MKSIDYLIFVLLGITVAAVACKESEETNPKKDFLISKSWKVSVYKINGVEVALMDCQKDNYLTFKSNNTYTDYVGAIKCDIYETNIDGTWTLSSDGKILTLKNVQGIQAASIEITESKLVLTITDDTDIIIMTCIPYP
jgi:hypothetical protein